MQNPSTNNSPLKKEWAQPQLMILSRNEDINAKSFPAAHENTVHLTHLPGGTPFWVKNGQTEHNFSVGAPAQSHFLS